MHWLQAQSAYHKCRQDNDNWANDRLLPEVGIGAGRSCYPSPLFCQSLGACVSSNGFGATASADPSMGIGQQLRSFWLKVLPSLQTDTHSPASRSPRPKSNPLRPTRAPQSRNSLSNGAELQTSVFLRPTKSSFSTSHQSKLGCEVVTGRRDTKRRKCRHGCGKCFSTSVKRHRPRNPSQRGWPLGPSGRSSMLVRRGTPWPKICGLACRAW